MKKFFALFLVVFMVFAVGCSANTVPALHTIPYPEKYETHNDEYGADAFNNSLDKQSSRYYVFNDYYNMKSEGSLHILESFETYQQSTEYTCGNAAALMVLNHFGVTDYDEMKLAEIMKVDTTHGTAVEDIAGFFDSIGWTVDVHANTDYRFESPEEFSKYVANNIDNNIPIMVDWADWSGHWQVIIGVDTMDTESPYDDVLILADPYDITDHYQDGYYTYPLGRFTSLWFEGSCTANEEPYQQPFVTAYPSN